MQTDKKVLTKRERVMLLIMVVVGLFAITVMFVIIPFFNQLTDKNTTLSSLEQEKTQIDTTLASEAVIRENHQAALRLHEANSMRFLNEALNNDIGRMLTQLCDTHRLQPIDQKLSAPAEFVIEQNGGGENPGATGDPVFLIVSAVMTVRGEYDDLKSMLDTVEQTEYIRISRVSFSRNPSTEEKELDRITVYFQVTMLKNLAA